MKKGCKFIDSRLLISLIFILLLVLFVFLTYQGYFNLKFKIKNYRANSLDLISQRMSSVLIEINSFPRSAGNDILFLSRLSSLKNVINSEENNSDKLENLKYDFLEFSKENTAYYQLRYIDEFGNEVVRVNFDGVNCSIISEDRLQNKKYRYYFNETLKLDKEEVFISRLDLNIEGNELENRGTIENPIYVPMIRYATPIYDKNENPKGIVISNVYADYFLEDIRRSQREGEEVFLIDHEGYYLAHSNRAKEYGFIFEMRNNFYEDYSIQKENIILNGRENIETKDSVFSFRFIYPTAINFEVHKGSEKILGKDPERKYYWILVSVSDKNLLNQMNNNLKNNYLFSLLFYALIILIVLILVIFVKSGRRKKAKWRRG